MRVLMRNINIYRGTLSSWGFCSFKPLHGARRFKMVKDFMKNSHADYLFMKSFCLSFVKNFNLFSFFFLYFFLLSRFVYHAEFLYLSVCFHYILSSLILDTALSAITRESLWTTMKAICTAWSIWKWAAMLFSFASYTAGLVQTTMAITSKPFWDKPDDIISNSRCLRDSNRKDSHVYRSFLWKPFA